MGVQIPPLAPFDELCKGYDIIFIMFFDFENIVVKKI